MGKKSAVCGYVTDKKLIYGGDYNPEQWLESPDILRQDIELMKEARINRVSLGIFSWSMLEPREGEYQLGWLEEIISRLYENGISVTLATPSGARPRWLARTYPEVLRMNERRERSLYGERHNHCYTSPACREKTRLMNQKLAERFAGHPAVLMWHISNEYEGECHCPLCQQAFRLWLERRYGTIDNVNKAWWTHFWSHTYTSFEEIESPSSLGDRNVHGLNADWKRFVSDQTIDFMKQEIAALRDAGAVQPVTTNMMYDYQGINYGKMAEHVDVVSWDSYPLWHKQEDAMTAMDNAMQHDYMRSLKHKPFLLMESCPSATNWQGVSKLKKPGMLMNASLQAIAHGGDGIQYFQIRQSRGSSEKFHGAVIDHYGGKDTRVFQEVCAVGQTLERLAQIAGTKVKAQAALIYDVENRWAMEDAQGPRNDGLYYHEAVLKSYEALKRCGLDVDVIDMDQSLESYKLVAAPMLYMFRSGIEGKLRSFVEHGGILVMSYWSGIVDETDLCFLQGTPHGLMEVLGLRSEEIDGLYDWETNRAIPVKHNELGIENIYSCKNLCDLVRLDDAVALMEYETDFYAGKPALTAHGYGQGKAYYVCADMEADFYRDMYQKICDQERIERLIPHVPEGIVVSSRQSEEWNYLFIQNYKGSPVDIELPEETEIWEGDGSGTVNGRSTVVVRVRNRKLPYEEQGLRWAVDYDCFRVRNVIIWNSKAVTLAEFQGKRSGFWNIHIWKRRRLSTGVWRI